jgi:hypothetical protein
MSPFAPLLLAVALHGPGCPPGAGPSADAVPGGGAAAGLALTLNLPAYRLDLAGPEGTVRSYTVAIGSPRYRTPTGRFAVTRVQLNPWWHPPDSDWARRDTVTPPGPLNPMGRAKLHFDALYFLHGTPQANSLGTAASHGCVRMANADVLDLARRILSHARPDVPAAAVDAAERDARRTVEWALPEGVPLEIVYRVAEVREGALELFPDVYGRERGAIRSRALEALAGAGLDSAALDRPVLDSLVRASRRAPARLPLEALRRGGGAPGGPGASRPAAGWPSPPAREER